MELSIKELYQYEKDSMANITDEQKANMSALANAAGDAQEAVTHTVDSEGINASSNLTGLYKNDAGVIRVATMSIQKILFLHLTKK